ncbi:hypothetical protein KFE26_19040 [Shewanella sp. M16]|uniref:hypothetical protein n=1 Tax=Shewanella sp. M16 TaxID=2830837 RepID=UPI001BAE606D|nr:hypothetical protein [Shewanella sp. M16]MBS0044380.1 hypothetical protein [Shewanella sp. M16]
MTLVRAVGNQWLKAQLANRLELSLAPFESLQSLCCGSTSLGSVTNFMSTLIFIEGKPEWLELDATMNEKVLPDIVVLHCFFECCRLLFIKELSQQSVGQVEQLVFTLAEVWRKQYISYKEKDSASESICSMLERLSNQLMMLRLERRQFTRNMGIN